MEFYFSNKGHVLRGLRGPKIKLMEEKNLSKTIDNATHLCMLQLLPQKVKETMEAELEKSPNGQCLVMDANPTSVDVTILLHQCANILQEPKGLPPRRGVFDHRIPLKTDAKAGYYQTLQISINAKRYHSEASARNA